MKKLFSLLLITCMAFSFVPFVSASDSTETEAVSFDIPSITTFEIALKDVPLMANLFSNESFISELRTESPSADLINASNITKADNNCITFEKNHLLQTSKQENLTVSDFQKDVAMVYADSSKSDSTIDSSLTVRIYSTIFYRKTSDSVGREQIKLTKVTGYYTKSGSDGTFIGSQNVRLGQTGFTQGSYKTQYKDYPLATSQSSWTLTPPSSWLPVYTSNNPVVGATYTVTLKRASGSTWSFDLSNNVF